MYDCALELNTTEEYGFSRPVAETRLENKYKSLRRPIFFVAREDGKEKDIEREGELCWREDNGNIFLWELSVSNISGNG